MISRDYNKLADSMFRQLPKGAQARISLNYEVGKEPTLDSMTFNIPKPEKVRRSSTLKAKAKEEAVKPKEETRKTKPKEERHKTKPKEETLKKQETFKPRDEKYYMSALTSRSNSLASVHQEESDVEVPDKVTSVLEEKLVEPARKDGSFIARNILNREEFKYHRDLPTFKPQDVSTYEAALTRTNSVASVQELPPSRDPSFIGMLNFGPHADHSQLQPRFKAEDEPYYKPGFLTCSPSVASVVPPSTTNSFVGRRVEKQESIDYDIRQPRFNAEDEPFYLKGGVSAGLTPTRRGVILWEAIDKEHRW